MNPTTNNFQEYGSMKSTGREGRNKIKMINKR
jgi:hypothetical protein